MAPKRFGKYEVLARIATGGAANIFLARQPGAADFHKLVCLKTLLPERASDADFVAMFLDEARLAARLNHPNCVQIFDLGRVRGSYYISMEYIFGETLWNLLATVTKLRTPLPAPHVASIISSVCDGLHHAHELKDSSGRPYNLVHRDVSPQNVMITFEGQTKVVDFGIAKAETGRVPTMAGIVKGKFSYMSPEQITGGNIDRRSDVYSLGIVLFECLASRRLYRGETPEEIARLILEHRAPRLRDVVTDIPPALDNICAIALARHPSKRFQTAHAMGEALRDYLDSIRYAQSAAAIARLIDQRFEGQISDRRKIFESALAGSYDEAHLLKVLDARAVRDIDLFPDEEYPDNPDPDFVEPIAAPTITPIKEVAENRPASLLTDRRSDHDQLEETHNEEPEDDDEGRDQAATQFEPDVIEGDEQLYAVGESTRVDGDAESEYEEMAAAHVPTDGTTTVEHAEPVIGSRSGEAGPPAGASRSRPVSQQAATPDLEFGDRTELQPEAKIPHLDQDTGPVAVKSVLPPLPATRKPRARLVPAASRAKSATNGSDPHPTGATTARLQSQSPPPEPRRERGHHEEDNAGEPSTLTTDVSGDNLEQITARPPPLRNDPTAPERLPYVSGPILVRPHTNDMVPPPIDPHEALVSTAVNQASYDGVSVKEVKEGIWADPTEGRDSGPLPPVEDQKTPPQFPQPAAAVAIANAAIATANATAGTNLNATANAQTKPLNAVDPNQRYGSMALVAALALGIAIGLVLGLVLARLVYAPVTIPVPVRDHSETN